MNRLALERAAYRQPMLVGDGFVFKNFESFTEDRIRFLDNPKYLLQFIDACKFVESQIWLPVSDWHRENDAYVSRLIPILTWEYGREFDLGPVIAALDHHRVDMVLIDPDSIEPLTGFQPYILELEREMMARILQRLAL